MENKKINYNTNFGKNINDLKVDTLEKEYICKNIDKIITKIMESIKSNKTKFLRVNEIKYNTEIFTIKYSKITIDEKVYFYQYIYETENEKNYIIRLSDEKNKNWFMSSYPETKSESDFSQIENKNRIDIQFSNNKNIQDYILRHSIDSFLVYNKNILINIHKNNLK